LSGLWQAQPACEIKNVKGLDDKPQQHPADALAALAAGQREPDPPNDPEPEPQSEVVDEALAEQTGLVGEHALRARRARSASIGADDARSRSAAYKRTMVPLLLAVGGLLLLVGILSAMMLTGRQAAGPPDDRLVLVTLISFPLAAMLIFGAWWFHRDVKGK